MAVTILERPNGQILGAGVTAPIDDNGGTGDFRIISTLHGLVNGDYVYISSDIENYNGFWVVDIDGVNTFCIIPYTGGSRVQYISGSSVTYYPSVLTHGWSAVHLPITYRLSNDLYPNNGVDTSRSINSVQNATGWTVLQLSGSLGTVHTYDFIKITLPNDTDVSGIYQIVEYISDTVLIINLDYDSGIDFTSATAIKHYNNYNIIVRVYAGINASHQWTAQKPYELAATKEFIPDENNEAFFSIDDILRSYVTTRNNLVLGTLPNNIDFWTNFYIEVAESYDDSDGYTFGTFTSEFTSDQSEFEGSAVNAKLEFKNIYSGYLSEYLMTNNAAKFLTLFTIPVLFGCGDDTPNCYQDISFINPINDTDLNITKKFYLNGVLITTVNTILGTQDSGVLRVELESECDYDRVDITLSEIVTDAVFVSQVSAADNSWQDVTFGEGLFVAVASSGAGNRVMTSPDGVTWTTQSSAANDNWSSVAYGNGIFVAVSISGTVMYSSDGVTWNLGTAAAVLNWQGVTFGNGIFVAVSSFGSGNRVMTSTDGNTWTSQVTPTPDSDLYAVIYGKGLFVAVGEGAGTDDVMISADGINWSFGVAINGNYRAIAYGKNTFVAVGQSGSAMMSTNGIDWTSITLPGGAGISWLSITFGKGSFVAVSATSVAYSTNGIDWSSGTIAIAHSWNGITFGDGSFVAVASSGTGDRVMTSETETLVQISETKQFKIDCNCCRQEIRLTWLNNLAGFDYWVFCGEKDVIREIQEAMTTKKNILPNWPNSYGADADTIKKQTLRVSNKAYTVRSQHLTSDEADAISYIKSSILVQIVNSQTDRRTVIVDTDSFVVRKDGDKTFEIAFNISFTDDIPVQTL